MNNLDYNPHKSFLVNWFNNAFCSHSLEGSYFKQWENRAKKPFHKFIGYMDNYRRLMFFKVSIYFAYRSGLTASHLHELNEFITELIKDIERD